MRTKLTLRLDERLIKHAKAYAKRTGRSVSQMIADYFALLRQGGRKETMKLTPTVKSLKGALRDADMGVEDYRHHLEDKYL